MSEKLPSRTITELTEALHKSIKDKFPADGENGFKLVDSYTRLKGRVHTPAFISEVTGIDPASENRGSIGTSQFAADVSFSSYIILSYNHTGNAKLAVREMACRVLLHLQTNSFDLVGVTGAEIIQSEPDEFSVEPGGSGGGQQQQYEVWRIDWRVGILLGENMWKEEDRDPITEVNTGFAPDIGSEHLTDYERALTGDATIS